ncbi:Serine carboxypeptidase 2 [Spatholobus suberectus]|nr:Serine carboxypeptidase 2 [Spatholobus suberectus]
MEAAPATLTGYRLQHYLATQSKSIKIFTGLILLLTLSNSVASSAIVKTLPGFLGELPFRLETGYIGVGEKDEVQLFYYFIQSEERPATDPLMLWLTGGPGCSGLSGLIYEIDNKAGNLPPIYLKGYVLGNPLTDEKIDYNSRIKFANRVALLSDGLYEETKLDCHGEYIYPNKSDARCIQDLERVNMCLRDIFIGMVLEPSCAYSAKLNKVNWGPSPRDVSDALLLEVNPTSDALLLDVNPPELWCRADNYLFIYIWANDKEVQEALHVRNGTIQQWDRCNKSLSNVYDDIISSLDYHRNFTSEDLTAIIYSGDHDMVIPYVGTEEWIQSLNLTVSSDDEWRPWFVDGQVAGYTEIYRMKKYSITFATVKGAGHTAPEYKPKQCFNMIRRWFATYFL